MAPECGRCKYHPQQTNFPRAFQTQIHKTSPPKTQKASIDMEAFVQRRHAEFTLTVRRISFVA